MANNTGHLYCSSDILCQFKDLKNRFSSLPEKSNNVEVEMSNKEAIYNWLFMKENIFWNRRYILHFSLLCYFVKAPLETTAETIVNSEFDKSAW